MPPSDPVPPASGDEPKEPALLANPLEFIAEVHLRQRRISAMIDALALAPKLDRPAALTVLRFLEEEGDMTLHDTAENLFPLLARRCTEEDAIESAISRIQADQTEAIGLLPEVRSTLAGCLDSGADPTPGDRATMARFAGHVRRRLVAENAILLPIARARLNRADLRLLSRRMRLRRGLPPIPETADAG